jgi:3-dehydroquinate synthase
MINIKSHRGKYSVIFEDYIKELKKFTKDTIFIIDKNILKIYPRIKIKLKNKKKILINATEINKDFTNVYKILEKLSSYKCSKNNLIVAIGGGITQDITCFVSSIYLRGISWIFFPTTLEAQGDSCIGSKSSINFFKKKNQIGTFFPPKKVIIDINFLKTLNKNQILSGMGEMLHYYVINKNNLNFFIKNYLLAVNNKKILIKIIKKSLLIKKKFIENDEFDAKNRKLLNYGHTFGHAIEAYTNFKIPHGVAVAKGIGLANFISYKKGIINKKNKEKIDNIIKIVTKNYSIKKFNIKKFINYLKKDKKYKKGSVDLILLKNNKLEICNQKFDKNFSKTIDEFFKKV